MRSFLSDVRGNFAVMGSLVALPLVVSMGGAVDMSRVYAGKRHLQSAVDAAVLSVANSAEQDTAKLSIMAQNYILANLDEKRLVYDGLIGITVTKQNVELSTAGHVETPFLSLINIREVGFNQIAKADRKSEDKVEVALVLDNTWSMSEKDKYGASKIDTLKSAAKSLVDKVLSDPRGLVSVGVVPYADYVNVGLSNRNASWLDVADDYSVPAPAQICETRTTKSVCKERAPTYACTVTTDGVEAPSTCGGSCTKSETQTVAPYQSCSGGGNPTNYKWFGCVGSRRLGTSRLNDGNFSEKYPGYLTTSQKCLNPIMPLSKDRAAVTSAINGLIINIGSYRPYTYIPAGLIWGQNMLSPPAPLQEGGPYALDNVNPRKIMILMTDGDNTRRFQSSDGAHVSLSSNVSTANSQVATVNQESLSICNYSKSMKIEIFTVAFMVDNPGALTLLKSCATDKDHFFDASDSASLISAFAGIAGSISAIRLTK
jgi:Flp pilus assembly protein TadG